MKDTAAWGIRATQGTFSSFRWFGIELFRLLLGPKGLNR